ncbi:MAG: pyridine nucleotide-disulfide oxidoreductase [Flavobacteriaceae bacterium]|nr:pyridine nucleotide-disulfide oxidoreductase [Flavobacteriaceae bacterium]|tara:strand:- start:573197 stop:573802 length:606 start_codon:yes stop_codon:yes gene_type:complete
MIYDVLIIGGGVSGMQCALVLGSAKDKPFAENKQIGLLSHQRASHLQNALFNNVLGLPAGKLGRNILSEGLQQLQEQYPHVDLLQKEKVTEVKTLEEGYEIVTNKNTYTSKIVVVALNYAKPFTIKGLEPYLIRHKKSNPKKDRIQLQNKDHYIKDGLYCCGTIAGHRSQFAIAAGSGASVATDILTLWNNGVHTKVHDKI